MTIKRINKNFTIGLVITFVIALVAKGLAELPFISIMGHLVVAIILGMIVKATVGVKEQYDSGIQFSSKKLLRFGIVLLGMSLNLVDLYHAGLSVFIIALLNLAFAFIIVYFLAKSFGVNENIGLLTASGTAICGASAIVAIAPQIRANQNEIAISVAIIALLGTAFTLAYTFLYSLLNLTPELFGIFAGGTLHEVAHVVAAANAGGNAAVEMAVITKLSRVALLVPVALLVGYIVSRRKKSDEDQNETNGTIVFPWFIVGFLLVSGFNSLGIVSESISDVIVTIAYLLIAMAMAGLGLKVNFKYFKTEGLKPFVVTLIGSILLALFGYLLIVLFYLI